MTLNKDGLEAAHSRLEELAGMRSIPSILTRAGREFIADKAITAYLSALPAPDGLVEKLEAMAKWLDDGLGHEILSPKPLREAATVIQTLQRERDEILGDFSTTAHALSAAEQQVRDMRAGLEFYRDGFTFTTNPRYGGLEWKPTETLLDDCGNTARLLLKEGGE